MWSAKFMVASVLAAAVVGCPPRSPPPEPEPGGWSPWKSGPCSVTCGASGTITNTRKCNNPPPKYGGEYCDGEDTQIERCNYGPCSGSLMAIGGEYQSDYIRSAEGVNTSCEFPLPLGRDRHISVTTNDGKTLVCGGRTRTPSTWHSRTYGRTCLQFDYQTKSWQNHSLLAQRRADATAVVLSKGVYVLGGVGVHNATEFLATGSTEWTQGPVIPGTSYFGRGLCTAKLSDTEFVILGISEPIVYNELTGNWTKWPRKYEANSVYAASCVGLGDKVLLAGGKLDYFSRQLTNRTVLYDTKTGLSREVGSLKYPRLAAAMALYRGKPIILGGWDGSEYRSDGEVWNVDTETWEETDIHLNIARSRFSLVNMAEEIEC